MGGINILSLLMYGRTPQATNNLLNEECQINFANFTTKSHRLWRVTEKRNSYMIAILRGRRIKIE